MFVKLKGMLLLEKAGNTLLDHKHEKSIKSIFHEQPFRTQLPKSPLSLFSALRTGFCL